MLLYFTATIKSPCECVRYPLGPTLSDVNRFPPRHFLSWAGPPPSALKVRRLFILLNSSRLPNSLPPSPCHRALATVTQSCPLPGIFLRSKLLRPLWEFNGSCWRAEVRAPPKSHTAQGSPAKGSPSQEGPKSAAAASAKFAAPAISASQAKQVKAGPDNASEEASTLEKESDTAPLRGAYAERAANVSTTQIV